MWACVCHYKSTRTHKLHHLFVQTQEKNCVFFLLFSNPWALGGIRSSWTHKMWIPIEFVDIPLTIYISCANSTEIIMRVNVRYPNPSAVAAAAMILIWKKERRKVEALKVNYSDGSCGIGSIQHIASFIQFMRLCIERSPTTYLLDWANKWVQCGEKNIQDWSVIIHSEHRLDLTFTRSSEL